MNEIRLPVSTRSEYDYREEIHLLAGFRKIGLLDIRLRELYQSSLKCSEFQQVNRGHLRPR